MTIKEVFNVLTLLLCVGMGVPLPLVALNLFETSYEAPWFRYSCISIAFLQYLGLGTLLYFLNPVYATIFACCLMPFYLNYAYLMRVPKEEKK